MSMKGLCLIFCIAVLTSCSSSQAPEGKFEVLIVGGNLLDGTGAEAYPADILIRGDSIAFIGSLDQRKIEVEKVVDAKGKIVSPGFIDAHAHGNPLTNGEFKNFLSMGVTTICLGQDGFSYASSDYQSWMDSVETKGLGVNVLTFMGHSTLRELSGTGYKPRPTEVELNLMKEILTNAIKQGAFGLSTGLEYTPGYYAQGNELAALAKVVGENGGIIMSHMRNEDDDQIENSINELLAQGSFAPVHISHFKVVYGNGPERAEYLLSKLDSARRNGINITADMYPYTASYTGIGIVFPDWAKAPNDYEKVKSSRRKELEMFIRERVTKRNGPEATLFGNGDWKGMTLLQVADSLHIPFEKVLIDVIGSEGTSGAYFVMNEALQTVLIQDSLVSISSDGSPTMHHPRGYGTFAKIIRHYVYETASFDLPDVIRKMTSLPASIIGLEDRGTLRVGGKADLLVFDPEQVIDNATYEEPHQLAGGFDYVIINGKIAKSPEGFEAGLSGLFLRK